MQSRYHRFLQLVIIAGDLLLLNLCFVLAGVIRFDEIRIQETQYYNYYVQLIAFFNVSWLMLTLVFKTYDLPRSLEPRKATSKVFNAFFSHIFLLLILLVSLKLDRYSRLFLIYFYGAFFMVVLPWRFFFLRWLRAYRKKGLNLKEVILLGEGQRLKRFYETLLRLPEFGLKPIAYFSDKPIDGIPLTGDLADAKFYIKHHSVDEAYCAFDNEVDVLPWYKMADENLVRFRLIPHLGLEHSANVSIDFLDEVPVVIHRKEPLEYLHNRLLKRAEDIVVSLFIMLIVYPWLFPLLIVLVRLCGKGPVFFKQVRTGLQDDEFTILKFRSMKVNTQADELQATDGDIRITAIGQFMRRHNLDELPQFWNVLKGEMSIVGPRPHMLAHTEEYRNIIDRYMVRHFVKPGITGLAQVNGLRGETQDPKKMEERVKADVYYIENWSLLLDLKIILMTIWSTVVGSKP